MLFLVDKKLASFGFGACFAGLASFFAKLAGLFLGSSRLSWYVMLPEP